MFKLSIQFATIAALTSFVTKMGDDVIEGTVTHDQPLTEGNQSSPTVAKPASRSRAKKDTAAPVAAPTVATNVAPFPGGFTPGGAPSPAPQLVSQPAPAAPASAPVVAPVAQAPVAAPVAAPAPVAVAAPAQVSPERQGFNNNCAQLIQYLEQGGTARGYTPEQLGSVIANSMAESGIQPGTKITAMSDAQIQVFYPILYKNVLAAVPQA